MADEDDQIAALQSKLDAQQALLRDWRTRELAEGNRPPEELLADARRRRDAARKAVQALQSKHHALQAERREKSTKLDKLLAKQKSAAKIANPELALPSLALRGGGDDDAVREIQALMKENQELEESLKQHQGTRLHLEKLQNEKRDASRRVKDLRAEEKVLREQLEIKKSELTELQEQMKPSPVRARYEADVSRLRKEINASSAARTDAERKAGVHSKRLMRVRQVLGGFLKAEGVKAQQPLPAADEALAARLADHIAALAEKVGALERTVSAREEKAAALQASSTQAAEELKRLVARRGKEQRRAVGLLTEGAFDGAAASTTDAAAAAGAEPLDAGSARQAAVARSSKQPGKGTKSTKMGGKPAPPPDDVPPLEAGLADEPGSSTDRQDGDDAPQGA